MDSLGYTCVRRNGRITFREARWGWFATRGGALKLWALWRMVEALVSSAVARRDDVAGRWVVDVQDAVESPSVSARDVSLDHVRLAARNLRKEAGAAKLQPGQQGDAKWASSLLGSAGLGSARQRLIIGEEAHSTGAPGGGTRPCRPCGRTANRGGEE